MDIGPTEHPRCNERQIHKIYVSSRGLPYWDVSSFRLVELRHQCQLKILKKSLLGSLNLTPGFMSVENLEEFFFLICSILGICPISWVCLEKFKLAYATSQTEQIKGICSVSGSSCQTNVCFVLESNVVCAILCIFLIRFKPLY